MINFYRQLFVTTALLACSLIILCGCSDDSISLYPVSGQVLFRGKPAKNSLVVFHDKRPAEQIRDIPIPRGKTDSEGKFELTCYGQRSGAPAGEYRVSVMLPGADMPESPPHVVEGEQGGDPESLDANTPAIDPESVNTGPIVEGREYLDPETSGLNAVVLEKENVLPPFELK